MQHQTENIQPRVSNSKIIMAKSFFETFINQKQLKRQTSDSRGRKVHQKQISIAKTPEPITKICNKVENEGLTRMNTISEQPNNELQKLKEKLEYM